MDEIDYDWTDGMDVQSTKVNSSANEKKLLRSVRSEISSLSAKSWKELFEIVRQEWNRRKR